MRTKSESWASVLGGLLLAVIFSVGMWVYAVFVINKLLTWYNIPIHLTLLQWGVVGTVVGCLKRNSSEDKGDKGSPVIYRVFKMFLSEFFALTVGLVFWYIVYCLR
jgi:hypothetical protein